MILFNRMMKVLLLALVLTLVLANGGFACIKPEVECLCTAVTVCPKESGCANH